ncbi:MAG TPA: hypothetical protein VGN88_05440 [Phycisphaerae bacterium]|jgi:hypothetical protein
MTLTPALSPPATTTASPADNTPQKIHAAITLTDSILRCWLMMGLGLFGVGAMFRDFQIAQEFEFLRTPCLLAEMIAGSTVAFCFGAAMHYLDTARAANSNLGWFWRFLLATQKRVLLICQIGAMGMALFACALMLFGEKIPGPDWSILDRTWNPPVTATEP